MMSVFAGLALLLAAIGLYGVLSQVVTQRTAEIGIRMSLGADARGIRRLVLGSAMAATAIGLVAGGALGAAGIRALSSQLFGLDRSSPAAWAAAALVMTLVAIVATWVPARRAAAIDPVRAMRME
jgi:putative ABC transport system permease protein